MFIKFPDASKMLRLYTDLYITFFSVSKLTLKEKVLSVFPTFGRSFKVEVLEASGN